MNEETTVSLATLARGAVIEQFDEELKAVLQNIIDPNTADGARSVALSVTLKPSGDRQTCSVDISCTSRLKQSKGLQTLLYVGSDGRGHAIAFEHNPEQYKLPVPAPAPLRPVGGQKEGE